MCKELVSVLIVIATFIFIMTVVACVSIALHFKHQKVLEDLSRYSINLTATMDETIPTILESFIQNCLEDYLIITGDIAVKDYITEEKEKNLRKQLTDVVSNRISNNMIDKLSVYYNKANISSIIADKIYIVVTNYVIVHNESIKESYQNNQSVVDILN